MALMAASAPLKPGEKKRSEWGIVASAAVLMCELAVNWR
jgi:hypothetical protein